MSKSPISEARLIANRQNAKQSTGPRTPEGKLRAAANSTKHGITGRKVLLPSGDYDYHNQFINGLIADLRPTGNLELQIARNIADAHWRLSQIRSVEEAMFASSPQQPLAPPSTDPDYIDPNTFADPSDEPPQPDPVAVLLTAARAFLHNSPAFTNLSLYEQRIHRTIKSSMEDLRKLQAERLARHRREMDDAVDHLRERKMHNQPFDPPADGFVFSNDDVELAFHHQIRRNQVWSAKKCAFDPEEFQKRHAPKAA